jgi:hypothetical protein
MSSSMWLLIIFGVIIGGPALFFLILNDRDQAKARRKRETAQLAYKAALGRLKASPSDPNLKQQTLELGRFYANLTRDRKGVTIFDEMALMNDINAATAAATATSAPVPAATHEQRLQRLATLKAQGLIDEAEYTAQRTKILGEL